MRTFLFFATLCLALAPLAAAGPGAQVHTLDGSSGCESYGDYYSGGNSTPDGGYWYQSYWSERKCLDRQNVTSASAQDNNGEVASAAVGNAHDNSSTWSSNSYSTWGNQSWSNSQSGSHEYADEWSRGASVSSRAGAASVGDGCDARSTDSSSYSNYGGPDRRSNAYSNSQRDSAYGCGQSASSNLAGTPASVSAANYDCTSHAHDYGGSWQNTYGYQSYHQGERSDQCFSGPVASAEGQTLGAGLGNGCQANDWSYSSASWNGNDSSSHADNATWSRCYSGLVAQGPDGSFLFLGERDTSGRHCTDGECSGGSSSNIVLELDWEHDPAQPYPIIVGVPLP